MTEAAQRESTSSAFAEDAGLILRVRDGDLAAYDELFLRHRDPALRFARRVCTAERAEDLVAEGFARVLDLLGRGKGPDVAFRAYLFTTIRTAHLNSLRTLDRERLIGDHGPVSHLVPVLEDPDERFDQRAIKRAFRSLPSRWQAVLWMTVVEGLTTEEAGDRLDLKANAVASLAHRARAGLRQAYLAEHLLEGAEERSCRHPLAQLPPYLRDRLGARARERLETHLTGCPSCLDAALQLAEVDTALGGAVPPAALADLARGRRSAPARRVVGVVAALGVITALTAVLERPADRRHQESGPAVTGTASPRATPSHPASAPPTRGPWGSSTMALLALRERTTTRSGVEVHEVLIPVQHPAPGTTLLITTTRSIRVVGGTGQADGWTCRPGAGTALEKAPVATKRISCTYEGSGDDDPVLLDLAVAATMTLEAELLPPAGYLDKSLADNVRRLTLVGAARS